MIRKSWMCALVTLSIVIGMIGLLAFTGEPVHHVTESVSVAPTAGEPETGPMIQANGLMLTY